ncbi:M23 family metallopeptidase [Kitasatospora sp. NPDC048365]|uniref:M23 family metallopeptidase n=1 Tax=Kitasatospora sp. NPDC048365 TaxID=3364050 RepID=UPI0037246E14
MASTQTADSSGTATSLLDHPTGHDTRHRLPRQSRGTGPLLGVTAMTAALGATGFAAAPAGHAADAPAAPSVTAPDEASGAVLSADPGLALAARIQQQADGRRTADDESARIAAAQEAQARRAAQETAAPLGDHALPVAGYRLAAQFAQAGAHWAHLHTGLDFAARTGTPVTAVTGGTVTSAGWSGPYGYRVIQTLPDGTELWYCHLARITTPAGPVTTGTVLGTVGATGNVTGVTGPHLHLEVRPDGAAPIDPLTWLGSHGLTP